MLQNWLIKLDCGSKRRRSSDEETGDKDGSNEKSQRQQSKRFFVNVNNLQT